MIVKVPPTSSSGVTLFCRVRRRQVGDPLGQPANTQITRILDHRNQQTLLGVDGNAEMLRLRVGDGLLLGVDRRVHLRVDLQSLDRRLRDERQVGQRRALALLEVVLDLGTDLRDRGEIHLDRCCELSRDLEGLDHALGNRLAQP